jgi:hypothetical protein
MGHFLRAEDYLQGILDKLDETRNTAARSVSTRAACENGNFIRNTASTLIERVKQEREENDVKNKNRVKTYNGKRASGIACWLSFVGAFDTLAMIGHRLSHVQSVMYMRMRRIQAIHIFRHDLTENIHIIKKLFGDDPPKQGFLATLSRRSGKSYFQTTFMAALTVSQPNSNVYCYTIGGKQSTQWQEDLLKVLEKFKGTKYDWIRERKSGLEKIVIINGIWGTKNSVSSFPVSANNGNGIIDFLLPICLQFSFSLVLTRPSTWLRGTQM